MNFSGADNINFKKEILWVSFSGAENLIKKKNFFGSAFQVLRFLFEHFQAPQISALSLMNLITMDSMTSILTNSEQMESPGRRLSNKTAVVKIQPL